MMKNPTSKYSKEFLNKTIEVWQPFSEVPITSRDALEITENMTALFNFLIASEKKSIDKSMNKNIA
jgi:hypothetical protein